MSTLLFVFIFLFGTIIGSFLNVVIYRFNTGRTMVSGRSICMTCNRNLRWYELIPVFSFLIQSGRCRTCAIKISNQYPLVELLTGVVFALIAYHFIPILYLSSSLYLFFAVFYALIFSILIVITAYDIRHKVIPDKLVYTFVALSLFSIIVNQVGMGHFFAMPSLMSILAGPLLALPFALLWLLSRGKWIGLGDAKLVLGIGWLLGIMKGLAALMVAFWAGAIIGIIVIILSHNKVSMKTEIPFAPFLILGTLIVFLMGLDIVTLSLLFQF